MTEIFSVGGRGRPGEPETGLIPVTAKKARGRLRRAALNNAAMQVDKNDGVRLDVFIVHQRCIRQFFKQKRAAKSNAFRIHARPVKP